MPLFAGLGLLATALTMYYNGFDTLLILFLDPLGRLTQNDMLLPVPLFTLMGYIIANSKAPQRLVYASHLVTKKVLGKSAYAVGIMALVISAFFTPFTGASGVTIVAIGGILFPVLTMANYSRNLSLGIVTSSGSLGLLFFPSIPVIIYGIVSNNKVSITDLFKAGILPGILLIILPSIYVWYKTRKMEQITDVDFSGSDSGEKSLKKLALEILVLPVLFYFFQTGKVAVSEIGMFALLYFFILEVVIFKEIEFNKLPEVIMESASVIGGILIIIFFATSFTSFMIDYEIPQKIFIWIQTYIKSKWTFLILLNIFLLVVGSFMDIISAIIVTAPLVIPVAELYGVNMIHLGILFLTNLEIGYITPPVGMNLFLSSFRFKVPMTEIYKSILPFLAVLIVAQLIITYVPDLSLMFFKH
jgi:tripartite ATP-independent transporter DctM subunit